MLDKHEETAWQKASASLDASAKIYGFRVDSVHSETFKFLGGLNRADNLNTIDEENDENTENIDKKKNKNKNLPSSYVKFFSFYFKIIKIDLFTLEVNSIYILN